MSDLRFIAEQPADKICGGSASVCIPAHPHSCIYRDIARNPEMATQELRSVAEITRDEPKYANLTSRFAFVQHSWFFNAEIVQQLLVKLRPKVVLEVGSWMGASARFVASMGFVEKVVCVDHWDRNRVENWRPGAHPEEWMDNMYEHFLANCLHTGLESKIFPLRLDSIEGARYLAELGQKFDWIYIDGAHATEMVRKDIRNYFPMLKQNGLFCGDDWSFATEPENVQVAVTEFARELKCTLKAAGNFWWYEF